MYSTTSCADRETLKTSYYRMISFGLVLVTPTFLSGMNNSFPAVALPQMELDINSASWFASIGIYTSTVSTVVVGLIIDRFGRKPTLLYSIAPSICGWFLLYTSRSVPLLLLGQALNGLSINAGSYPALVYAGECVMTNDVRLRNAFMTWISLSTSLGNTLMLVMGNFVDYGNACLLSFALSLGAMALVYTVVPESPAWLRGRGRVGDAEWSQQRLKVGGQPIIDDVGGRRSTAASSVAGDLDGTSPSLRRRLEQLRRPEIYKPAFILSVAAVLTSFCGTSTVGSYVINIIYDSVPGVRRVWYDDAAAGAAAAVDVTSVDVSSLDGRRLLESYRLSLYCGVAMCAGSLVSVYVLPRTGLVRMLVASKLCVAVSLLTLTYGSAVRPYDQLLVRGLAVAFIAFLAGLEIGPRKTYAVELFPAQAKGFASVPAVASGLGIATANKLFPYLRLQYGAYAYCFFAASCLVAALYVRVMVPEVVGRTLDDIGTEYADEKS